MDRLTQRNEDGAARYPLPEGYEPPYPVVTQEAVDRLAAYEDTGLEPEKLKQLVDAIRKHKVVFLTEDRLMKKMLIKVDGDWTDFTITELQDFLRAKREGRLVVLPCKVGDTVYFAAWFGTAPHIVKRIIDPYFYTDDARGMGSTADFRLSDFGKSVFLTREEAEEAQTKIEED